MRIFLSAHRPEYNGIENAARNNELKAALEALGVRRIRDVKGCYKGVVEDSFEVIRGDAEMQSILDLANKFDQESVLVVTMLDDAYLVFKDQEVIDMGIFLEVASKPENEDYSIIEGKFYVIR